MRILLVLRLVWRMLLLRLVRVLLTLGVLALPRRDYHLNWGGCVGLSVRMLKLQVLLRLLVLRQGIIWKPVVGVRCLLLVILIEVLVWRLPRVGILRVVEIVRHLHVCPGGKHASPSTAHSCLLSQHRLCTEPSLQINGSRCFSSMLTHDILTERCSVVPVLSSFSTRPSLVPVLHLVLRHSDYLGL
jgi:hypothetical protein